MIAKLTSDQIISFLIIISILLIASRLFGELFRLIKQPAVMGELIAGIVLGPSLFGSLFPNTFQSIFITPRQSYSAFDGLAQIGIMLLLFVAGMEVNFNVMKRRGKAAAKISIASVLLPFIAGFTVTWLFYDTLFASPTTDKVIPALFMGTALCITALSVAAKILMDLNLISNRFGNMILTSAMINDFIGWLLFTIVISLANLKQEGMNWWQTILTVIVFAVILLTVGIKFIDRAFQFVNKVATKPGANMSLAISFCFLGALFTEWIGIHAIFGAFLMGVAVGASKNFLDKSKEILQQFITNIFAPLFFASIGLRVNFIANFNLDIVVIVLLIAGFGKIIGGFIGARLSGFKVNKAWAVGFGMNARGSMEIVLGLHCSSGKDY